MEHESKTNQKLFYKALKNTRTEIQQDIYFIKNKNITVQKKNHTEMERIL